MDEGGDLTELAGVAEADTQAAFAWSEAEDYPEPADSGWPFWVTAAAVGVSLSLVTVAVVLGYQHLGDTSESVVAAAPSTTSTTTSPPAPVAAPSVPPPPPVTVTTVVVQPPPPPVPSPLPPARSLASYDGELLATLRSQGWVLPNPAATIDDAHAICLMLRQGKSRAETEVIYADAAGRSVVEVSPFIGTIIDTYPNCP
ncbi:hypothetical protein I5I01_gp40 [Mycobacterium phage MooMoo]|uniref:DUF732 domain-containing protein n=1 Tax=Mycobacterium phage MooMoo TaxID=2108127 RepID=A0A2P1JR77_9CAUD|nr:hypothetical protein I5I01_gp40 [Mycobacterium phage MooMoo]AVO21645.1 hypothetical protein SEA_MOOMOO_40 [Mycobacterium phage MooMoo]